MNIDPIILQLRTYAPSFEARVAGGLNVEAVLASAHLPMPCAFVLMSADDAGENQLQGGIHQRITDQFEVLVLMLTGDERGQSVADPMHALRAELCLALVGWQPSQDYTPVEYGGGEIVLIDRHRVVYRFTFRAHWWLGSGTTPATFEERTQAELPELENVDISFDAIAPMADPNIAKPGPDGRIEHQISIQVNPPNPPKTQP